MDVIAESVVVENKAQLVEYLAAGCKTPDNFRLGAEQEMFVFQGPDCQPAFYDGEAPGIKTLLESMYRLDWQPIKENGVPIALSRKGCAITLEPGGQFEFVGKALKNAHETRAESQAFFAELSLLANELGLSFLAMGHQPKHTREELPWMPKERYRVMRAYMPSRGNLGLDMMQRTCAIQVTADFADEADMVRKFRVALALQPIVVALFANSPFKESRIGNSLSHRAAAWHDTDPDRCGSLPFVFEEGMGFERYTDYVLDVPMYFVLRDGQYVDASGLSFRDFLDGRLSVLPGQRPMISDWINHLSTVFPQVRLKQFLEFRGADAGDAVNRVPALVALWAGLLYDSQSLAEAWDRVQDWSEDERRELESNVVRDGFNTPFRDSTVKELALWMLELSRKGLDRRDIRSDAGFTESQYLLPLQKAAESGQTFAEELIHHFTDQWQEDMDIALPAMCSQTFS
ncbi:MAG: glutamate--cysteine ligase [Planctomycetota bacterium]